MQFMKRLRDPVRNGEITRTVRIWKSLRVKVGNRYLLEPGHIVVDAVHSIELSDITPEIARETGFKGVVDLLKTAKHGTGDQVFLIDFHYVPPEA
ncbi:MAG: ASCH domain-containing protein [Pseudomonadota bacterium]